MGEHSLVMLHFYIGPIFPYFFDFKLFVTFFFSKFPPCGRSSIVCIPLFFVDVAVLCGAVLVVKGQEFAKMKLSEGSKHPGFVSIDICGIDEGGN
jgi:hypothetical protein